LIVGLYVDKILKATFNEKLLTILELYFLTYTDLQKEKNINL